MSRSRLPGLLEVEHPVADHLAPDAEAPAVAERRQDGVRDAPDAGLQGRAVPDATGDVLRDPAGRVVHDRRHRRAGRVARLDDEVQPLQRQHPVAVHVGHGRVDLGDHQTAAPAHGLHGRREHVDLGAQRHGALVRQGRVQEHDVRRQPARIEQRDHRQPGGEVGQPGAAPGARSDEGRLQGDSLAVRHPGLRVQQVQDVGLQGGVDLPQQRPGRRRVAADDHAGPGRQGGQQPVELTSRHRPQHGRSRRCAREAKVPDRDTPHSNRISGFV